MPGPGPVHTSRCTQLTPGCSPETNGKRLQQPMPHAMAALEAKLSGSRARHKLDEERITADGTDQYGPGQAFTDIDTCKGDNSC